MICSHCHYWREFNEAMQRLIPAWPVDDAPPHICGYRKLHPERN